jgi:hypothetical protein
MKYGLNIQPAGALDFLSIGTLVHLCWLLGSSVLIIESQMS